MVTQIGRLVPKEAEIARNRPLFPGTWSSGRIAAEHGGLVAEYEVNPAGWSPERVRNWLMASGDDEPEAILDCDDVLVALGSWRRGQENAAWGVRAFMAGVGQLRWLGSPRAPKENRQARGPRLGLLMG